jgi:hypothetical protein
MKILIPLLSLILIAACSEGRSVRLRPADVAGVSGLETEEFIGLKEYIESTTNTPTIPQDGDVAVYQVDLKKEEIKEFVIDKDKDKDKESESEGEDTIRCRYSFTKALIKQVITVETLPMAPPTQDEIGQESKEDEDEVKVVRRTDTVTPIEPTYAPILNIAEEKEKCDAQVSQLVEVKTPLVIDLGANFTNFKDFLSRQIISVLNSCSKGQRVQGSNCLSADVDLLRSPTPLTYNLKVRFGWMNDAGNRSSTELAMQFSPEMVHFSPTGLFNYSGTFLNPITAIDLPYSQISLQCLGNKGDCL